MTRAAIGIPSKGRLMDDTLALFAKVGAPIEKAGDRGYRGAIPAYPDVDVEFLSASEIARNLRSGLIQAGVTGEDLLRELVPDADAAVQIEARLGFGHANVVVAVPACWLDVDTMHDLDEAAEQFAVRHGRYMRVATKYALLTRRFFSAHGVTRYRTVESPGATEGAPAAGTAEAIVDITTTGNTLRANGLKVLDGGTILQSEACFMTSRSAPLVPSLTALTAAIQQVTAQSSG
jgi:ATP phosphoribosyltransferase